MIIRPQDQAEGEGVLPGGLRTTELAVTRICDTKKLQNIAM